MDPENGKPENPQSWNRYAYAVNSPVKYVDPDGEAIDTFLDIAGLGYDIYELIRAPSWKNAGILAGDVILTAVPFVPNVGGVKLAAKGIDKGLDVVSVAKTGGRLDNLKPFTSRNFRENLKRASGAVPEGSHAHHVFPQEFAQRFQKMGIDVNDPRLARISLGAWWEARDHLKKAHEYNKRWRDFLETNPTAEQALEFARALAGEYELKVMF